MQSRGIVWALAPGFAFGFEDMRSASTDDFWVPERANGLGSMANYFSGFRVSKWLYTNFDNVVGQNEGQWLQQQEGSNSTMTVCSAAATVKGAKVQ